VHAAHLYLLSQFLSPLTNRRADRYGGDAAGRATFPLEVVRAVRERLGPGYPVLVRINAVESVEGGQTIEDAVVVARLLEAAGADAIHASALRRIVFGETEGQPPIQAFSALPKEFPRALNVPFAAAIKRAVNIPVIAVGKLGEGEAAARAFAESAADVVAIGRQMIADPAAAGKILAGRGDEIMWCQECLTCMASLAKGAGIQCSVNRNLTGEPAYRPKSEG
jgi:2,4-dienoyl-CoA reductase-like NADH-dependent reductase (Old Yellow Enzyme family)